MSEMTAQPKKKWASLQQYADAFGVDHSTAQRWFHAGLIPGARQVAPRRAIRVPAELVTDSASVA
ncbi:hypothetical protein SAMN04488550_4567 [Gordonia malaquae]|uniref:Helix-turn-helix domain-containing protein n=1 Tax=Gordonia malaquae NBRC 108250 TaxID=1223542 RepID=M3UM39_GORML|nr:hypothetical protein [Gordonia malaquae]GAC80855.1 hypothetical protein GM1_023_00140 [Gordonia malaquae NBRC 108250]SEB66690.1 hypothetical protein SAMN04488550_0583 [Gordonia malaquae]SEE57261.1 hypothetical protein SAMN04488550_4567 [Gordonia malaquae]